MQAMARVSHHSLCWLGLEPYSWAVFKQGLKVRKAKGNSEENKTLDRVMEYVGVVGVELVDILVSINPRVEELVPHVPM